MYEELMKEIDIKKIDVVDIPFTGKIKGLYADNVIALNANIKTTVEKSCVLAEELGHYYTSSGDILDQSKLANRKQENRARKWAYERLIRFNALISAYKSGCKNRYELAEYLDVTEKFLEDALIYFKEKYGLYYTADNYIIYFEPLGVLEVYKD